jgi:hypothetical protein
MCMNDYHDNELRQMSELEIAWFAGLFEGEGCITFAGVNKTQVRLLIPSVDRDVIEKVRAVTGIGTIYTQNYTTPVNHLSGVIHRWQAGRFIENQALLRLILPHMSQRRSTKIQEALAIAPHPYKRGPRTRRQYCDRGHELAGDNLSQGTRCKACRNLKARERYAKAHATAEASK